MKTVQIRTALISVFDKNGLDEIVHQLAAQNVRILSTGGTLKYIQDLGVEAEAVEDLTTYPSILDGRVKTLHPKVFGGILARREKSHEEQLEQYEIPAIDLVVVDLYPFEETVKSTNDESAIIEKIDIGGISLIRAAAKNYKDVVVVPSKDEYGYLFDILKEKSGEASFDNRKHLATRAFAVSSHYDTMIHNYFAGESHTAFRASFQPHASLRYGENPHQQGTFFGDLSEAFDQLQGKELSYNNLVDVDGAMQIMREFVKAGPTFAVLKHTNTCGLATRDSVLEAWKAALAGDPISAFGGILICNKEIDGPTAEAIDQLFYEVLLAPSFSEEAMEILSKKKKRILLKINSYPAPRHMFKSILTGVIRQDSDHKTEKTDDLKVVTEKKPSGPELRDLLFANIAVKHLKSNTIVLAKNNQLVGMGCGQTSRVDALKQAITKAESFGFDLKGCVMASDAFFPFPDCVEIADQAGITAVIQPGGSVKDQDSIDYCDAHGMSMVMTGTRHFKH